MLTLKPFLNLTAYMKLDKTGLAKRINAAEGLSNEDKAALLDLLRSHKKYGLVWEDKPEAAEERLRDELPILAEVKERAIISENKDAPNHILRGQPRGTCHIGVYA